MPVSKPLWLVLLVRTHILLLGFVGLVKIGECYSLKKKKTFLVKGLALSWQYYFGE